jgi:hypothetical protein
MVEARAVDSTARVKLFISKRIAVFRVGQADSLPADFQSASYFGIQELKAIEKSAGRLSACPTFKTNGHE